MNRLSEGKKNQESFRVTPWGQLDTTNLIHFQEKILAKTEFGG